MNGQYEQIVAIEAQWGIRFKEGDMRPRIEYFHDAVRTLTSGAEQMYERHGRLSVEHLAYDLSQLRQITSKPIGVGIISKQTEKSPHTDVMVPDNNPRPYRDRPDRAVRQQLSQLYKDYTVLFAALFAEVADYNFQTRQDEMDTTVEDMTLVEDILEKLINGDITPEQAQANLDQIENDSLREELQNAINQRKLAHRDKEIIMDRLAQVEQQIEKEKQTVDQAHLHFVTGQLAVYEDAKETVKRLAGQGLNLAGKFVETALGQAAGRGMGQGR